MPAPLTLLAAFVIVAAQGIEPLRKSDLVKLLSGGALSQQEIAQLVRRNCLTFVPTERDRQDLRTLGAEPEVLGAVDGCARRRAPPAAPRPAPRAVAPVRPLATTPPAAPPLPRASPPPATASAARSGFVEGGGQAGVAGARLPRALVFEVRDSGGAPLAGQTVAFAGINARVTPSSVTTDATGRVRSGVTLGERVGSATVIGTIGPVEKQVAFNVAAGSAAQIVVACGAASSLAGRFTMRPDSTLVLHVTVRDAFGNGTTLTGLRAAAADARVFRVLSTAEETGSVTLKPGQPGTTSLAVIANGMRQYLTVTVMPPGAREPADCR